ncbi:outer membrane protein assembly factor BamE [Acidiphilium sp. AL]|uniref:Outer membrane protein assembly factor BamE n=1 Tax=Acidiphilium iwatense TaxID=768198 RepID=A0ABS9DX08_9PROT|nr:MULTISPECIES: outer membrane protein assembly factor BamE [Acidiphilium]MCF3947267.1 outer membrane protein assembly factor BamE [Acidiphilium iwatense]MCU4159719.1 outer membrane protein assembly factor BamE [Acidiphilium sp. AL]
MRRPAIKLHRLFPLLLLPALAGCAIFSARPHYRGNAVSAHELKQLRPGVSTKADARALLGSPTLRETFNDDDWLYVSQITKRRIARTQGVIRQHVVVLQFNQQGVLQSIHGIDKKNAVMVAMAGGHTPAPGGRASLFQQLVGGVGHYNPGLGAGQPGGFGGGSPGYGGGNAGGFSGF